MTKNRENSVLKAGREDSLPNWGPLQVSCWSTKKALVAKTIPTKVQRANSLPFQFVSFGKNQSQAPVGGFHAKPPGNWTPMKLFIGEGDQEGEFFLNLNLVIRKGQFSIKDEEYGGIVLAQLAPVL
jgi:hypothetical protein